MICAALTTSVGTRHNQGMTLLSRIEWVLAHRAEQVGASARAWCEKAGVSPSYLGTLRTRIVAGRDASMRHAQAQLLAAKAGVRTEWLLSGTGPRDIDQEPTVELDARYPNLTAVLEHEANARRWSPQAIAAAKALKLKADEDQTEAQWMRLQRSRTSVPALALGLQVRECWCRRTR